MAEELPTGYYLDNFEYLVEYVDRHYPDVLREEESWFSTTFRSLSRDARRLYVRLIQRRGPVFRLDKLHYDEIVDIASAALELESRCLVASVDAIDVQTLNSLITRAEILDWFEDLDSRQLKTQLCDAVGSLGPVEIRRHLPLEIIQPLGLPTIRVYRLLFFGNLHQDFTDFVLRDLGVSPFEDYVLEPGARYFDNRSTVEQTLDSYDLDALCRELIHEDEQRLLEEVARRYLLHIKVSDVLQRRFGKLFNRVAREFERYGNDQLALTIYERSDLSPARERRARIHARLGEPHTALELCRLMLDEPIDEVELEFARRFSWRLRREAAPPAAWIVRPDRDSFATGQIVVTRNDDMKVERLAQQWFEYRGFDTHYVENGLLTGLFGLYFWPVIFAPVRGAFFNPLQRGPADLFSHEFIENRRQLIAARLEQMNDAGFVREATLRCYREKYGIANHFVSWRFLDEALLDRALTHIPIHHLQMVFQRLTRDMKQNRTGLPDLILFDEQHYSLVEIKGPGDVLQDNQRRWFRFFHRANIPARITHVRWL